MESLAWPSLVDLIFLLLLVLPKLGKLLALEAVACVLPQAGGSQLVAAVMPAGGRAEALG